MDTDTILKEIKLFKGIEDSNQDELLRLIIKDSVQRIIAEANLYSEDTIEELPDTVTFVVRDVAIKRYNKIDSEGAISDSEEGRSFNWENSYLDEYRDLLSRLSNKRITKGVARFF